MEKLETVIVGAGQAGLAVSRCLQRLGRENVVLEKEDRPGSAWSLERWDSFTLVTPNWSLKLPDAEYAGPDPHGYMGRAELAVLFERYVERFRLPVRYGVRVEAIEREGDRYRPLTTAGELEARHVVVATGGLQAPRLPPFASALSPGILQIPSNRYRRPDLLPPGAVLVAGSGQSGCQIAEELYRAGRTVYLSTGSTGRVPRRYRGRDIFEWLDLTGFLDRTVSQLPTPAARFGGAPQVTGQGGGRSLNLHSFHRDGVVLLGRLSGADGGRLTFASDLAEHLAKADSFEVELCGRIDAYIAAHGLPDPPETLPVLRDACDAPTITGLDAGAAGIRTVIWALGYRFDGSMVRLPVFDDLGYPVQTDEATAFPGLHFAGLPFLPRMRTGLLIGAEGAAEAIAARIGGPGS